MFLAFFLAGTAAAQSKIYYVSSRATDTGDGSSWANATTLTKALDKAVAGDQIWVQGFETLTGDNLYVAPKEGFAVKSGVQLYGGFAGTESRLSQRVTLGKPYQLKYRSVLSGDIQQNDTAGSVDLIFPANGTRSDNATHVLSVNLDPTQASGNNNTYPTVINGFSIGNGQAAGTGDAGKGGGIYVYSDNSKGGVFRIERCFLISNYATQGGAVYVDASVKSVNGETSLINQSVVFNNVAGDRAAVENQAGGIYLAGEATVVNTSIFNNENGGVRLSPESKVVNVTIARNTGAGVDMTAGGSGDAHVYNSIIWGNTQLYLQNDPGFRNSAYHEVVSSDPATPDENGNIYVAKENRGDKFGPMFDAPSLKTSYDRDFNWRESAYPLWSWNVLEGSVMIDKGANNYYDQNVYGSEDMAGNPRISGDRISVGAYEYQYLPATRIRYVKPTATGTGDGSSWDNASGDLQKMIDDLADNNVSQQAGEVWVAAGTYKPQSQLISGMNYSASFRMRDGISVYGGFAGNETSKQERAKGTMPWDFTNVTVLEAAYYESKLAWTNSKWTVGSDSRHVVWFAPMSGESEFTRITTLDGVTVQGGYAQGNTGLDDFKTDCGGGVYMDGANTYLTNCIVKENYATADGGGVYLKNGRIETSLIYNNNADANGGAVYVDNRGLVLRSMLSNNSALNGAGVYLHNGAEAAGDEADDHPEYLILSTSVVSNNTARGNGAVYCDKGGVLMQNTITNNQCTTATDATDVKASQTGGVYIDEYALVVNTVLWNNRMGQGSGINIPMYARNPSSSKVRFMYNAISGVNNAIWNNTLQEQTLSLVDMNSGKQDDGSSIGPRFKEPASGMNFDIETDYGVRQDWASGMIPYYWEPVDGSNLWARGMALGLLPSEVVLAPELDMEGNLFAQKPAVGAFSVGAPGIKHATVGDSLVVYVDVNCTEPDHDGSSWATGFRSLNNAISYLAGLDAATVGTKKLVVRVLEGDIWPRYAFTNNDPKTATITVPVTTSGQPVYLYGGYHRTTDNNTVIRDPLTYRSVINGNTEGKDITQGLYHCITVERGAKLVLDGFHVINGYAAGEASCQYGAGLLAHAGSEVTVRNCIFENNTAQEGAAIDAREAVLTMENCVVNNNTNITETASVVVAQTLSMEHVTVANNMGAAPANTGSLYASSFAVGNSDNNTLTDLASTGAEGAKNFANPTNNVGAILGFDTYLGGYSVFRPLTSSEAAGTHIINKVSSATSLSADITTINDRNLGGVPDLGAYEADLPKAGSVYYVRTDGDDNSDGLSWEHALRTVTAALNKAEGYPVAANRPQIWVAAGTYTGTIDDNSKIHSQPYAYKMVEGVNVYGGFPSSGSPGEHDRNPNDNETILEAQNNPTSFPTKLSDGENTVGRVLVQEDAFNIETVWNGFTIKNGFLNTHLRYSISGDFFKVATGLKDGSNDQGLGQVAGAGALLRGNGVLENCKITDNRILSWNKNKINSGGGTHGAGAGVYCIGGVLRNCKVLNNELRVYSNQDYYTAADKVGSAFAYGAGIYMRNDTIDTKEYKAAVYNTVVAGNILKANVWAKDGSAEGGTAVYHTIAIGAGICQVSGDFYNNTIVGNKAYTDNSSRTNIICGGLLLYNGAKIYNCIIYNNTGETKRPIDEYYGLAENKDEQIVCLKLRPGGKGDEWWLQPDGDNLSSGAADSKRNNGYLVEKNSIDIHYSNVGRLDENGNTVKSTFLEYEDVTYESRNNTFLYPEFVDESNADYHLQNGSPAINSGTEDIMNVVIPEYDAEYTNRIKDCGIDMGAFESTNEGNVLCTETQEDGRTIFTYYVSQNGVGLRSGENPANAACATKLQAILTDAGKKVSTSTSASAIVKVAGYEDASFVYNANTLASATNPQSYTYVIPEGVTLMGGYYDGNYNDGAYIDGSGWDDATGEFERNSMKFRTVLSAIAKPTQGSTITQEVNGYHTVTFGAWPGTAALAKPAVIDGVWLEDGSATSLAGAGNPNTRGGGAIVPGGAHVRNCVVRNCAANEGGGLYLMPGATVSGTLIMNNTAEDGGGVYADNTGVTEDSRAHILSSTIAGNTASSSGGGIYIEDGAVMSANTVIFGNQSGSDKNVSGVTSQQFADSQLSEIYNVTVDNQRQTDFYPFNYCFVEKQEMPSDFENTSLESDSTLYFTGNYYQLKDYSLLIKHGMKNIYQDGKSSGSSTTQPCFVATFNVSASDMQNVDRVQVTKAADRLDAGAFAYEGGILPTELFTRIFVSPTTNITLAAGADMSQYLGRSFYTSFSTLEDALGYVRSMRKDGKNANTKFEILVSGGTYKPTYERTTTASVTHNQRLYSFVVPQGVSIYGGFKGDELYSSGGITEIPGEGGTVTVNDMGDITEILKARAYSDFNQNGIEEPWELANQTILSGQINASAEAKNTYHVVFTSNDTDSPNPVVLDGLTVMYGQTDNSLSVSTNEDEQGRGGGIYSNEVTYTISRCRLLNNTAVRGGAVFVRDADLNLSGCILAGNQTVTNAAQGTNTLTSRGGAAYVSGISREVSLRAVNTLWANNESADEGGAIGTNYADGLTTYHDPLLYILNNTFVRNKAVTNPVIYAHNGKSHIINTLIWGNQGETYQSGTNLSEIYDVSHSASDVNYVDKFGENNGYNNILLSTANMADNGPRFTNPSAEAGVKANSSASLWNPAAISVLTDAGDGTTHTKLEYPGEAGHADNQVTGAYQEWFSSTGYLGQNDVAEAYITGAYSRYSGPYGENGTQMCKPIDIGLYEYQYVSNFSTMLKIYVDTLSVGNGSGDSWANATDDLRGAIVGASNPTDQAGTRRIFVRDGKYTWSRLSAGSAYILNMSDNSLSDSLILKGSCTGSGEQQDFSKPTVVRNDVETPILMSVTANGKDVVFEGFTFANHSASETAKGMEVSVQSSGSLTLKNCGFRQNPVGLNVAGNSGPVLIYNTLFADGGTGLAADERTTVVNATFAQNTTDLTGTPKGIYNSVAWKNGTQKLTTDTEKKNVAIPGTVDNDNVLEGPNFVDPDNADVMSRDYRIRPNLLLLNKGSKDSYLAQVGISNFDNEKDLANNARLTGDEIDVGAYEYEATLKPIVYVKADLTGTADGNSWTTALGDLQGAVDLAGIYVNGNPGEHAYVFVHNNYRDAGLLNLSMPGVKVYGGMSDETSAATDVSGIVSDLLTQRKGMLESTGRSSLQDVTLGTDVVVDGFVVNGAATVNNGILSTSILNGAVAGQSDGVLYNSLALNSVSGVKAVNVTATGTIAYVTGSGNNRTSVSETNAYVTDDYWKYQLMETDDANLDKGTDAITQTCIDKVGHSRDLIGNQRIRNAVDNGCFETWNITGNYTITSADKPVGKSVVYVRKEQELQIQKADDGSLVYPAGQYFSPGYLLLEHHAGLRGCGNYINLTNFAVERDVKAGGNDLTVMPFDVTDVTPNADYSLKRYNGSTRAAYDYTFDDKDGKAWETLSQPGGSTEGFLITSDNDMTIRFSGNSYSEGGADKSVVLMKYNFNDPWTSTTSGGNRFTHKENMSWNLFGSPYLCAMNYGDMAYGRVLYGYTADTYKTVNTANETAGYIPAGDAVFTQTATLRERESVSIALPSSSGRQGDAYASSARLQLTLSPAEATRATADGASAADVLQLNAVPADEARQDFDLGADGVKWMSTAAVPQLYAVRSGNRYSLLSAVSEEGETPLGVTASKAGTYQLGIAGNEGYETVELTDHLTGRTVDLTAAPYTFTLPADTCIDQRFTLRFRTLDDEGADGGIRIRLQDDGSICVSGLEPGQRIQAYSVGGQLEWKHVATESQCVFRLQRGVHVVEVREGGTKRAVSKLMVP